jgi:hypothetical protein
MRVRHLRVVGERRPRTANWRVSSQRSLRLDGSNEDPVRDHAALAEWRHDVAELCASARRGLAPLVASKLVVLADCEFWIPDPALGSYTIAGLEMTLLTSQGARMALLRPRGLSLIAAMEVGSAQAKSALGRVDLEWGVERVVLLRYNDCTPSRWLSFSSGSRRVFGTSDFLELFSALSGRR